MKMCSAWLLVVALACGPALARGAVPHDACTANANAALAAMTRGNFKAVTRDFAPRLAKALPPARIKTAWSGAQRQLGAYESHSPARRQMFHAHPAAVASVQFAHATLDFVTACGAGDQLGSFLLLVPAAVNPSARAPVAAHVQANGVRVEPLDVPSPLGPLRGALTLPAGRGPFPAAVLVAGSGPSDMDETVGGAKPFRDLADGLAAAGVATLRYDKRAADYPLKVAANRRLTVDQEATDDALAAARLLARQPSIDPHRVFVLGHSEGGMLAPRIATREAHLAGVIMLAAPARPMLDVIAQQERDLGARTHKAKAEAAAAERKIASEKALLAKAIPAAPPAGAYGGVPQSWWLSLHDYHQVAVAKKLSLPMLIAQGGGDFQVSPTHDFDAWKKALARKSNVTFRLFPGLSHLFTPAGKTLTPADYHVPAHVDPKVIADIARWIKAQPPAR